MLKVRVWMAFTILAGWSGCAACQSPIEGEGSTLPGQCESQQPLVDPQQVDILFVIDNSGSMREEQEGVARELTAFVEELRRSGGVPLDFHVGVVTTSVYQHSVVNGVEGLSEYPEAGRLQPVPNALPDGGVELGTGNERVLTGGDPDLIPKFARLVQVGTFGSGQETPFEAARMALLSELASRPLDQGGNKGFLRDGARLLVVVLTDEDDCSEVRRPPRAYVGTDAARDYCSEQAADLTAVEEYHRLFTQDLKDSFGIPRQLVWASIGPVARTDKRAEGLVDQGTVRNVDCPTSFQPGHRIRALAERFDPSLENLDSICQPSYRDSLVAIAGLVNVSQRITVRNLPDPRLVQVEVVRADGTEQLCTLGNGGLSAYAPAAEEQPGYFEFGPDCRRRADDREVRLKLICVG